MAMIVSLRRWLAAAVCFALGAGAGAARTVEEVVVLPIALPAAGIERHDVTLTVFRDDARARRGERAPFLVLNHGRAATADARHKLGRARYSDNARWFVGLGYAVFVPTRVGYGVTGGPDLENSGPCSTKYYAPGFAAAADQTLAVIAHAKTQAWVDPARGLVVGQSFGGTTAIAVAARSVPGVVAAVNFAGGGGGNPRDRPQDPCRADALRDLFAGYGASARVPTLWLYSENDRYFGATRPRTWFDAFRARGGQGRYVVLPPHGSDGHPSFTGNPTAWRPAFESFVKGE